MQGMNARVDHCCGKLASWLQAGNSSQGLKTLFCDSQGLKTLFCDLSGLETRHDQLRTGTETAQPAGNTLKEVESNT